MLRKFKFEPIESNETVLNDCLKDELYYLRYHKIEFSEYLKVSVGSDHITIGTHFRNGETAPNSEICVHLRYGKISKIEMCANPTEWANKHERIITYNRGTLRPIFFKYCEEHLKMMDEKLAQ